MTTRSDRGGTVASSHVSGPDAPTETQFSGYPSHRDALHDPLSSARLLARRWRFLVGLVLLGAALGWINHAVSQETSVTPVEVDHYEATHVIVLDNNVPDTQRVLSVRNLNLLGKRITIGAVPDAVADRLGISAADAAQQVRVLIRSDSESIDIVAIAATPNLAEGLADSFADELLADLQREAERFAAESIASAEARLLEAEEILAETQQMIAAARSAGDTRTVGSLEQDEQQHHTARSQANNELLQARADGIPFVPLRSLDGADGTALAIAQSRFETLTDRASAGDNIEMLFGDEVEDLGGAGALAAVSSRLPGGALAKLAFGALLGLLVGCGIVLTASRLDSRVRSKRQVEEALDLPVIAEVPALGRLLRKQAARYSQEHPRSRFAEQHRVLASTVSYARSTRSHDTAQVVLVTSASPGEGKTTTVANLAAMIAEPGLDILLMNCDYRRPRLHVMTGSDYRPKELTSTDIPEIELIANVVDDQHAKPSEVIAAQRVVLEEARHLYDLIIIDTAPVLATNDAVELLDLVDDVILVARAGKTTLHAADRAAEMIERRRAHILGVAMTALESSHSADYYYYGGYYDDAPAIDRTFFRRALSGGVIDMTGEATDVGNRRSSADGEDAALLESDVSLENDESDSDGSPVRTKVGSSGLFDSSALADRAATVASRQAAQNDG